VLQDALTATLATGSARVRRLRCTSSGKLIMAEEGDTDFLARRTRTTQSAGTALDEMVDAIEARWPWLHEDEDPDAPPSVAIYAGTASSFQAGDLATTISAGDPHSPMRHHDDPVWILEALSHAHVTSDGSAFEIDLERRTGPLQLPPHHASAPPRLIGEFAVDDAGRLSRVTWRQKTFRRRPRWPGEPPKGAGTQTLELWDFGLAVEIEAPDVPRRLPGAALVDILQAWRHLRRRREWRAPG
jgi:hypothetical protein